MRHPILYAEQFWRRQRWFVVFLMAYAVAFAVYVASGSRWHLTPVVMLYLLFIAFAVLMFAAFYVYRRRSYVEVRDDGLKVSRLLSSHVIAYDNIRQVRVLPLKTVTADLPRRSTTPTMRQLNDHPSLILRLVGEPEQLALLAKRLNSTVGHRLIFDGTAAIPVKDAAAAASEIAPHLPRSANVNLGGAKRKRRRG